MKTELVINGERHQRIHLIGIGGVGMCALAQLLVDSGVTVSGSDIHDSPRLQKLRAARVQIHIGHDPSLVQGVNVVIHSPSIPRRNPELAAARKMGLPIISRAEGLAALVEGRTTLCVAGSHGKTTTTAMLAFILQHSGKDPGYMVGGLSSSLQAENAHLGNGPFVLEACEAFGALRWWRPHHCIITNIDDEHIEHYGSIDKLWSAFEKMVHRIPKEGTLAIGGDDPRLATIGHRTSRQAITYGIDPSNMVCGVIEEATSAGIAFSVHRDGHRLGRVALQVPGVHNVCNALGAFIIAETLGISFRDVSHSLSEFRGVARRCQLISGTSEIIILDDYAHHPAEIEASLRVARQTVRPEGRLMSILEPQLHSRVRRLRHSFAQALSLADEIIIMPVDAAGEASAESSDEALAEALRSLDVNFTQVSSTEDAIATALQRLNSADTLITMGLGKVAPVATLIRDSLGKKQEVGTFAAEPRGLSISIGRRVPNNHQQSILDQFVQNVGTLPDTPAVRCGAPELTYRELAERSQLLASYLRKCLGDDAPVIAVRTSRSLERVVAFVGILMARAIYLPLDPSLPDDRATFILKDAEAALVLSDNETFPATGIKVITFASLPDTRVSEIGTERLPRADDIAYIVYTSGTTGVPKGVEVGHGSLLNVARASVRKFGITPASSLSQVSSFGFDIAIGDMAIGLYAGACLEIPDSHSVNTGSSLAKFVKRSGITHLSLTPSLLSTLPSGDYPDLTHIIVCGEKCPEDLAARWSAKTHFFNAYGPAEATVWCTAGECAPDRDVVIGTALENTQVYILDDNLQPVMHGVIGEIWIAGVCLADGYLNQIELTNRRFKKLTLLDRETRVYRTGDLARMSEDGQIHFLGRADNQIKLRGFRIELTEIEIALRRHPDIRDAVVEVRKDPSGGDRLVAYLIPIYRQLPSLKRLAEFLSPWLPSYMIPSAVVQLERFPFNQNHKLDRKALPSPWRSSDTDNKRRTSPKTPTEKAISELLKRVLSYRADIDVRVPFVELGIDSLQSATLFSAIEAEFQVELPEDAFAEAETIEDLALYVEKVLPEKLLMKSRVSTPMESIIRAQLGYLAAWRGSRVNPDSLIRSHNVNGRDWPLFWCSQGTQECEELATHLGSDHALHGMRSGHLIFRYTDDNVTRLSKRYVDEMLALQPLGSFRIGGNCQGGIIARQIALELHSRGHTVERLYLLGQNKFMPYEGRVALIFSEAGYAHLCGTMKNPEKIFDLAYGATYTVSLIPGGRDNPFFTPQIGALADVLKTLASEASPPVN